MKTFTGITYEKPKEKDVSEIWFNDEDSAYVMIKHIKTVQPHTEEHPVSNESTTFYVVVVEGVNVSDVFV